jgi:hypothetical protein
MYGLCFQSKDFQKRISEKYFGICLQCTECRPAPWSTIASYRYVADELCWCNRVLLKKSESLSDWRISLNLWRLRFHYLVPGALHWPLSWGRWFQSIPSYHIQTDYIIILHLWPRRPTHVLFSASHCALHAFLFGPMHASLPAHLTPMTWCF